MGTHYPLKMSAPLGIVRYSFNLQMAGECPTRPAKKMSPPGKADIFVWIAQILPVLQGLAQATPLHPLWTFLLVEMNSFLP